MKCLETPLLKKNKKLQKQQDINIVQNLGTFKKKNFTITAGRCRYFSGIMQLSIQKIHSC